MLCLDQNTHTILLHIRNLTSSYFAIREDPQTHDTEEEWCL